MFKGVLGHCIVCNAMLALHGEQCDKCGKPDEKRCWKHHNQICPMRFKNHLLRRYRVKEYTQ